MSKAICVFCSSSSAVDEDFFRVAEELGAHLARRNHTLVYGGADVGPMGKLARAVHREGGQVIGIIPERFHGKGIAYLAADELIVTRDLRDRKTVMEQRSDAFVVLPGGFGTLEELFEMLTLRQLGFHAKPVALLNTEGFFDPLMEMFQRLYERRFVKPQHRELCWIGKTPAEALDYVENFKPQEPPAPRAPFNLESR